MKAPAPPAFRGRLAPGVPGQQRRQGVERAPALVPARSAPDLEVEMAAARVAGLADRADLLARVHTVPGPERRRLREVHVGVVERGSPAVDHDVVAGRPVIPRVLHPPAAGRDHAGAAAGEDVVALVRVAGAPRAEAGARAAEVVPPADGEDVVVEVEGVALEVLGLGAAGHLAVGTLCGEPERVAAGSCAGPVEGPAPVD